MIVNADGCAQTTEGDHMVIHGNGCSYAETLSDTFARLNWDGGLDIRTAPDDWHRLRQALGSECRWAILGDHRVIDLSGWWPQAARTAYVYADKRIGYGGVEVRDTKTGRLLAEVIW